MGWLIAALVAWYCHDALAHQLNLTKEALHAFRGDNKAVVFQRLSVLECEQETMLGLRKGPC